MQSSAGRKDLCPHFRFERLCDKVENPPPRVRGGRTCSRQDATAPTVQVAEVRGNMLRAGAVEQGNASSFAVK